MFKPNVAHAFTTMDDIITIKLSKTNVFILWFMGCAVRPTFPCNRLKRGKADAIFCSR